MSQYRQPYVPELGETQSFEMKSVRSDPLPLRSVPFRLSNCGAITSLSWRWAGVVQYQHCVFTRQVSFQILATYVRERRVHCMPSCIITCLHVHAVSYSTQKEPKAISTYIARLCVYYRLLLQGCSTKMLYLQYCNLINWQSNGKEMKRFKLLYHVYLVCK